MKKSITNQHQWAKVIRELEDEYDKVQSYDYAILNVLENVNGLKILDYGAGPAVMAKVLKEVGADVKVYDVSKEMREIASDKLGRSAVFDSVSSIPNNYFDIILCNLVLCIIDEKEVENVLKTIRKKITTKGRVFVGFCNPKIFDIKESRLDYRFPSGDEYHRVHEYKKVKKEGLYEIMEMHRPIEWYQERFNEQDFEIARTLFTKKYQLNGFQIQDFVIFELKKI